MLKAGGQLGLETQAELERTIDASTSIKGAYKLLRKPD
jgi:hypothetical protein